MKLVILSLVFVVVSATSAMAQVRCPLDVSSSAITHRPIEIKGGLQGVTVYSGPSEWPYSSYQLQWMGSDGVMRHIHLEWCGPINGITVVPVTIPFRLRSFKEQGFISWPLSGAMVRDVVYDANTPPNLLSNLDGEASVTGHLTLDPWMQDLRVGLTNIHHASPNGWTQFPIGYEYFQQNGDRLGVQGFVPMSTPLFPDEREQVEYGPGYGPYNTIAVVGEAGGVWGSHGITLDARDLPVDAPISSRWELPSLGVFAYGAHPELQTGVLAMYADADLHHGNPGLLLHSRVVSNGHRGDYIEPLEIPLAVRAGKHAISVTWTTDSGPFGIPGVALPNEKLTSLSGFNIEIGDGVASPPPSPTCQDPTASNLGGPLPCVFPPPPPPPPPAWIPVPGLPFEISQDGSHLSIFVNGTRLVWDVTPTP